MNLKILQFLLRHREVLLKVVEAAKGFQHAETYADRWAIVDTIARLVIPVLEEELKSNRLLSDEPKTLEEYDAKVMSAEAEFNTLGIDWKLLVEVIIPLLISILEAVAKRA